MKPSELLNDIDWLRNTAKKACDEAYQLSLEIHRLKGRWYNARKLEADCQARIRQITRDNLKNTNPHDQMVKAKT